MKVSSGVNCCLSDNGLSVQNLALNVASKGFTISVFNRSSSKTDATVSRAEKEGLSDKLTGYHDMKDFVASLQRPRYVPHNLLKLWSGVLKRIP